MPSLTRDQVVAIRHLVECVRYAQDENGDSLLGSRHIATRRFLKMVDRLLIDAEVENTRRETPRSLAHGNPR